MQFLNDPLSAFGLGGDPSASAVAAPTPESIELRRKMALSMLEQGQTPVKSKSQGVNNVLKSLIGAYEIRQADKADKASKDEADALLASVFGGGSVADKPRVAAKPAETSRPFSEGGSDGEAGPSADIAPYANAIASVESANAKNPYLAIGPKTRSGDRAIGKYQVMGNNIPEWSEKHLGRRLSVREFMNDPDAQEKVFAGEFGGYLKKYGNPDDAASMWFTGKPAAEGRDRNDLYTSQPEYLRRFNAALGKGGAQSASDDTREVSIPSTQQTSTSAPANPNLQRALLLLRNPRTAPIGQALLQKALTVETKDPLIVKMPGPDGAEVSMVYDRASGSLMPLSSLMPSQPAPSAMPVQEPAAAPAAGTVAAAPGVENIGEVGPGPLEMAAMASPVVGGVQQANTAGKGDLGATSPAMPTVMPAPRVLAAPAETPMTPAQVVNLPPGARPGVAWKGKAPEGYIQRQMPDGQFMVDARGQPLFELKSEADARAKATEKRADAAVTAEQQVGGVEDIISAARQVANLPGFEGAQKLGRASFDVSLPFQGGRVGGDLMSLPKSIGRVADPDNPSWAALDQIQSTQRSLELLVARPLMKGQGQVTQGEREMITDAIGNLAKATSAADYQFKLNKVQGMIKAMNVQGGVTRAAASTGAPSVAEIQSAVDMRKGTFSTARVQELAKKYNVPAIDMQKYIMTQAMRGRESAPRESSPAAPKKQPETVLEAMMARVGL